MKTPMITITALMLGPAAQAKYAALMVCMNRDPKAGQYDE